MKKNAAGTTATITATTNEATTLLSILFTLHFIVIYWHHRQTICDDKVPPF